MLKTIIVLPDGRELSSGMGTQNAVRRVTVTQCVNEDRELTLGSACANMVEAELITPGGGLTVTAGEELTVYREDEAGRRYKLGLFTAEKPTRPTANTMRVTAFDRMIRLDRDMRLWLEALTDWPYTVNDFTALLCAECGLQLKNAALPNGEYRIPKFTAESLTGRTLVKWLGQISGCFARITADGELEFAWFTPNTGVSIGPRAIAGAALGISYVETELSLEAAYIDAEAVGERLTVTSPAIRAVSGGGELHLEIDRAHTQFFYYQNSLSYEDYTVAAAEKVQLQQTDEDVGCVYPQGLAGEANTYRITGNYLLTATNAASLEPVAESLYARLRSVTYTPCKVVIPANPHIHAGDIVRILDKNGRVLTAYVMKKTQQGQRDTLECTGSPTRDSTTAVNNRSETALSGKVLNLRMDVEGLKLENRENRSKTAALSLSVDGIETQVRRQQTQIHSAVTMATQIRQDAQRIALEIQDIRDNGVTRVETTTGYTFGADGLQIRKSGEEMENRLDNTGMYVTRSGETILQANSAGVVATDVTVRNYLMVGSHARLEDFSGQRTACFFV